MRRIMHSFFSTFKAVICVDILSCEHNHYHTQSRRKTLRNVNLQNKCIGWLSLYYMEFPLCQKNGNSMLSYVKTPCAGFMSRQFLSIDSFSDCQVEHLVYLCLVDFAGSGIGCKSHASKTELRKLFTLEILVDHMRAPFVSIFSLLTFNTFMNRRNSVLNQVNWHRFVSCTFPRRQASE